MATKPFQPEVHTELALFEQCEAICGDHRTMLVGSLGRAAAFGDFREFDARGETLLVRASGSVRDIDAFNPVFDGDMEPHGSFPVDHCFWLPHITMRQDGSSVVLHDHDNKMSLEMSAELFLPEAPTLNGYDVHIPDVRTLYYLHLIAGAARRNDKLATLLLQQELRERRDVLPAELFCELDAFLAERQTKTLFRLKSCYQATASPATKQLLMPYIAKARKSLTAIKRLTAQ